MSREDVLRALASPADGSAVPDMEATYLGLVGIEDLAEAYAVLQAVERYRARRGDPAWAT